LGSDCRTYSEGNHGRNRTGVQRSEDLGGWDFFLLWAGAAVSLAEIWAGGLIVPLGLGLGLWAIVIGHLIGNTPWPWEGDRKPLGIPTMVAVRASFGLRGSYLAAALNGIQLIGWTAVMLILCGGAAKPYRRPTGFPIPLLGDPFGRGHNLLGAGGVPFLEMAAALLRGCPDPPVRGHDLSRFCRIRLGSTGSNSRAKRIPFMIGMDLVIAMPISWLPLVADYSRFAKNSRSSFWGTWIGYFLVSPGCYLLGLAASLATKSPDPSGRL